MWKGVDRASFHSSTPLNRGQRETEWIRESKGVEIVGLIGQTGWGIIENWESLREKSCD